MPPASVIGAFFIAIFFVSMIWYFAQMIDFYSEDSWFVEYGLPIIFSFSFGNLYSKIAMWMAPHTKVIAATIMVLILSFITIFGLYFIYMNPQYKLDHLDLHIECCIAITVAAIFEILDFKKNNLDF